MSEGLAPDTVSADLHLPDVLYHAAGATLFGGEVQGAYQYTKAKATSGETSTSWNLTPVLVQAAYNYLHSVGNPRAYAHNGKYIVQILYDILADIGADTAGMIRP